MGKHNSNDAFMREALGIAKTALEKGELPIAAIVVLDGKILASAHTAERAEKRRLVHAELLALEKADRLKPFPGKRSAVKLFTTLEPCMMCLGAAVTFGVGEIYYALESPLDGASELLQKFEGSSAVKLGYNVPKIHGGILREKSKALFELYIALHSSGGMWEWAKQLIQH